MRAKRQCCPWHASWVNWRAESFVSTAFREWQFSASNRAIKATNAYLDSNKTGLNAWTTTMHHKNHAEVLRRKTKFNLQSEQNMVRNHLNQPTLHKQMTVLRKICVSLSNCTRMKCVWHVARFQRCVSLLHRGLARNANKHLCATSMRVFVQTFLYGAMTKAKI